MATHCGDCGTPIPGGARYCTACGTPASKPSHPSAPTTGSKGGAPPSLPQRYEVVRFLGRGGMGRVFLCHDSILDVDVAVKVLPAEVAHDEEALGQIGREAKAAAKFRDCPGILSLYGFEQFGETWFLVMEFAGGGSIHESLKKEGALPEAECRRLGAEVAEALAFAHERGVLHRDIKPANVLLDGEGRAKVADFGIAKVMSDASSRRSMVTVAGTPVYMAPEIVLQQKVDGRADLYSLGCMLFEMAAGRRPFEGSYTEIAMIKTVGGSGPPAPRKVNPAISEGYAAIVMRLLQPDPEARFPDGRAVAAALRGSVPPPAIPRRSRTPFVALGAGVLCLAAGAAWWALRPPPPEPEKEKVKPAPVVEEKKTEPVVEPSPNPLPPAPSGFLVFTEPPGARVTVDGSEIGVAGSTGLPARPDPAKARVFKAWLADHEPAEETVAAGATQNVRLRLARLRGKVRFEGGRAGTSVRLTRESGAPMDLALGEDGTLGPVDVEVGSWIATLSCRGFDPRQERIRVETGPTLLVGAGLSEREGTLSVESRPPGAEVFVGDRLLGKTPLPPTGLKAGRHFLRLVHPDHDDHGQDIDVRAGEPLDLRTIELPPLAALDLTVLPPGVTAWMDGKEVRGLVRRKSGGISLEVRRKGCVPQAWRLDLKSGLTATVSLSRWVENPGSLDLSAIPADAAVSVDGKPVARAAGPLEVPAGEHRVALSREGYLPVPDIVLTVPAGESVLLPAQVWTPKVVVERAVPGLPPPPDTVLAAQKALASLPDGLERTAEGRLFWKKDGAEAVLVPAGEFSMGYAAGVADEKPVHKVFLSEFLVDRHEVTVGQYRKFAEETKRTMPKQDKDSTDLHPVVMVDWSDASAYATWAGRRLPSEAEWEMAALGTDGRPYPWGAKDDGKVRNGPGAGDGFPGLAPVGSFPGGAGPFGVLDTSGNASEWCADWYDLKYYAASPNKDPKGPANGINRVVRGGGFNVGSNLMRGNFRSGEKPIARFPHVGFRTAR
jgi:formylglycine-generating enzyme required for sulfatase activity